MQALLKSHSLLGRNAVKNIIIWLALTSMKKKEEENVN